MPGRSPLYAVAQLSAKPHRSVAADRRRESFARRYGGYIVPIAYIQLTKAVFPRSDNRSIRLQPQSKTFACHHRDNIAPRAHVQLSEFIVKPSTVQQLIVSSAMTTEYFSLRSLIQITPYSTGSI